jgi:hypothetical protein
MRGLIAVFLITTSVSAYAQSASMNVTSLGFDITKPVGENQVVTAALKHFDSMDKARTNKLTGWDLSAHMTASELKQADPDNDGTIDKSEYLVETIKRFDAADTDHDGSLSPSKWQTPAGQNLLKMLRMPIDQN